MEVVLCCDFFWRPVADVGERDVKGIARGNGGHQVEEEVAGTGWWQCAQGAETVWGSFSETDADGLVILHEKDESELVRFFFNLST